MGQVLTYWWRLPTWSRNVDNKVCYFGCLESNYYSFRVILMSLFTELSWCSFFATCINWLERNVSQMLLMLMFLVINCIFLRVMIDKTCIVQLIIILIKNSCFLLLHLISFNTSREYMHIYCTSSQCCISRYRLSLQWLSDVV